MRCARPDPAVTSALRARLLALAVRTWLLALAVRTWLLALAVALASPADRAFAAADEPRPFDVVVQGAGRLDDVIHRNLSLVRRQGEDGEVSRDRLERYAETAVDEARDIVATEGYFSPEVTTEVREREGRLQLVLSVKLGEAVRVSEVTLRFTGPIVDAPAGEPSDASARALWPLAVGEVFAASEWESAKREVLRHLQSRRFPAASIAASRAEVDPVRRTARLEVEYASGPEYRFGAIEMVGLKRYSPRVVESIAKVDPGTVYSRATLADMQTRLQALPYFGTVNVVTPLEGSDPAALPIRVEVTEAETQRLQMGVGFSTNYGMRGQIGWDDYDLFDRALRWRNLAKLDQREQIVTTRLGWPVRPNGWGDDIGLAWKRTDINNLLTRSVVVTPSISRIEPRSERSFSLITDLSWEKPEGGDTTYKQAVVPTYSWRYRTYDNLLDPRTGWEVVGQVGVASKVVLSDQDFVRTYGRIVRLFAITPTDTLALRAEGGVVFAQSRQGIPQQFLFRAGGDQSIRGYAYQSIGVQEGSAVVGGRYLVIGGAEYIHWLQPKLGAAVFYENGDAYDDPNARRWRAGYGAGVRYRSPVGPINVDLAYGEATRDFRFHFSLGIVF